MRKTFKMKKILFIVMASSAFSHAQGVVDVIAQESCDCIKGKKLDMAAIDDQKLKMEYGFCLLQSYNKHSGQYAKENPDAPINMSDGDSMRQFGEKIGMRMISVCPEVLMSAGESYLRESDEEVVEADLAIEGEITEIKSEQFVTIQVRDSNKRIHNFLMLDYFNSAGLLTNNEIRKKDRISVKYSEIELYDPKAKEFRYFKVISGLEKK
jgi:hypothetical protein